MRAGEDLDLCANAAAVVVETLQDNPHRSPAIPAIVAQQQRSSAILRNEKIVIAVGIRIRSDKAARPNELKRIQRCCGSDIGKAAIPHIAQQYQLPASAAFPGCSKIDPTVVVDVQS